MRITRCTNSRTVSLLILCGLLTVVLLACQGKQRVPDNRLVEDFSGKIALLPVRNMLTIYGKGVNFRCPLSGRTFVVGDIPPGSATYLTDQLFSILKKKESFEVISPSQASGAQFAQLAKAPPGQTELDLLVATGKALGVDAVVFGRLYRFAQRSGGSFAVTTPASVAFSLFLIDTSDGSLIWNGHFKETQQSLFENLFDAEKFFKRKMKWLTAEELASYGLKEVLQQLPLD